MEDLSRIAAPGRLILASAALCAVQASHGSDKRAIDIGAFVLASTQCRVDTAAGSVCSGAAPAPQVSTTGRVAASTGQYAGQLVMRMTPVAASLDSRGTVAPSAERVVLTIAP
jgi:hypothetical protein